MERRSIRRTVSGIVGEQVVDGFGFIEPLSNLRPQPAFSGRVVPWRGSPRSGRCCREKASAIPESSGPEEQVDVRDADELSDDEAGDAPGDRTDDGESDRVI